MAKKKTDNEVMEKSEKVVEAKAKNSKKATKKETEAERKAKILDKQKVNGIITGFWEFMSQNAAIGLAIGVVIGDATKKLVDAIVLKIITPFISIFLPNTQSLTNLSFKVRGQTFAYGEVIQLFINFTIILFIVYFTVKVLLRREDLIQKK